MAIFGQRWKREFPLLDGEIRTSVPRGTDIPRPIADGESKEP